MAPVSEATVELLEWYLQLYPVPETPGDVRAEFCERRRPVPVPEFLVRSQNKRLWCVRWPNGTVKWETVESLKARHLLPPLKGRLEDRALVAAIRQARAETAAT